MSVEENKAVAKRWNEEIINERKFEALGEVLAEDYVNYNPSDSSWSPDMQGLERMKEAAKEALEGGWFAEHPTWRIFVDDIIGEGDKVAARLTAYEEGKAVRHTIVFYRLSDGKIVDDWYCNTQIQD
ncbi:MAG: ester cyclase [Planctomycetota bacterium]|jgi:predicted ester cyclase